MAQYEGFVSSVKEDGTAEVTIQPERECIPGADACVNRRVCHCSAECSIISIAAQNKAGAEVGDRVSVSRSTVALVRNGLVLVGIPLAALCVGVALAAFLTQGLAVERAGVALAVLGILAVGIVIGVIAYRHGRDGTGPVIERIIQKKQEM